jgi:small-conductance mechanosensitive channel
MYPLAATVEPLREWVAARPVALAFALLVAASLAAAYVVTVFGFALLRRATAYTAADLDDVLLRELRAPVTMTVGSGGFYLAGRWLDVAPGQAALLQAGALTVVLVAWAWTVTRVGDRAIERLGPDSGLSEIAPIFENVLNVVVVAGVLTLVLSIWRVDVTPLLASAGIAGIAVGFAARDTIANFFGSIALYADGTYAVGDFVELDSGEAGTVLDISVRSTRLLTRDDVVITVPNAVLNAATIVNQSAPERRTRVRVPVDVAYGSDVDDVEEALLTVADEAESVVASPAPRARFRRFGDSALEYELLCWVPAPVRAARAVHDLNRGVYAAFAARDIEIPFPQRSLHVQSAEEPGIAAHPADSLDG